MTPALIGVCQRQDTDKRRTVPLMSPPTAEPMHKATVRPSFNGQPGRQLPVMFLLQRTT